MVDNRFDTPGVDARFPSPGEDVRFAVSGIDGEHLEDGTDTRFEGPTYGGSPEPALADMVATTFTMLDEGKWPTAAQAVDPHGFFDPLRNVTTFGYLIESDHVYAVVAEFDHDTGVISRRTVVGQSALDNDDHVHITLEQLSDYRIMAFYGSHSSGGNWAVTTAANDISAWTPLTTFVAQTYPRMINRPDGSGGGDVLFTYRSGNGNYKLRLINYTAMGTPAAAGSEIAIATTPGRIYAGGTALRDGKLWVIYTIADEPDDYRRNGYLLAYDLATGEISNLDGSRTQMDEPDDADAAAYFTIIDVGADKNTIPQMAWDNRGNLHVIWATGSATGAWNVYHKFWDGSDWSTPEVLGTVYEYNYDTGFSDGPNIAFIDGRIMAAWPTGALGGGFVRGGAAMMVGEYIDEVWTTLEVADAPIVGGFPSISHIKNASLEFAFFTSERRLDDLSGNLQIWTIGTVVPDWSDGEVQGNRGIWHVDPSTCWSDDGVTPATVNGVVFRIDDSSGWGNHLYHVTGANQGVLRQDGTAYYVEFGADTFYDTAANNWVTLEGSTLIFAGRPSAIVSVPVLMGANGPLDQANRLNNLRIQTSGAAGATAYYGMSATGDNTATGQIANGVDFIAEGVIASNGVGGHTVEAFVNGVGNGATTVGGAINYTAKRIMTVGRNRYDGGLRFVGRFYGAEAYARDIGATERTARRAVLAGLYP